MYEPSAKGNIQNHRSWLTLHPSLGKKVFTWNFKLICKRQFTAFPKEMGGKVAVPKSGCGLNIKKSKHYAYEAENGIQLDGRKSDPPVTYWFGSVWMEDHQGVRGTLILKSVGLAGFIWQTFDMYLSQSERLFRWHMTSFNQIHLCQSL